MNCCSGCGASTTIISPAWPISSRRYVIDEGEVHVFDVKSGQFVPAAVAPHSGTGPYHHFEEHNTAAGDGSSQT